MAPVRANGRPGEHSHRSDGEDGEESTSRNDGFGRLNVHHAEGDITFDMSARVAWIGDAEDEWEYDLRALGDGGRWALDATAILDHASYGSISAELRKNFALVMVKLNLLDGSEFQPVLFALTGKGLMSEEGLTPGRTAGAGLATTF